MTARARIFVAAVAAALMLGAMPGMAATISGKSVPALAKGTVEAATAAFTDQTMLIERWPISGAINMKRALPLGDTFIAYFMPNGRVLAWGDQKRVVTGTWNLRPGNLSISGMMLCLDVSGGSGTCMVLNYLKDYIHDAVPGNVFGLKAGAPAPAVVPGGRSIKGVVARVGKAE
jgi:hypothetical protein